MVGLPDWFSARSELRAVAGRFAPLARKAIRLRHEPMDDEGVGIGRSKLGGAPDLPPDMAWPASRLPMPEPHGPIAGGVGGDVPLAPDGRILLPFVAQIDLADVPDFPDRRLLPERGQLVFFYNTIVYQDWRPIAWGHPANARVLHVDGPIERRRQPDEIPEEARWPAARLTLAAEMTLPPLESAAVDALGLTEEQRGAYGEEDDERHVNDVRHLLLGWPTCCQPYALELSYRDAHPVLFPDEPRLPAAGVPPAAQVERCRLLLQVDSCPELNMHFGRGGRLYFFIREDDLARGDFSRVWTCEQ